MHIRHWRQHRRLETAYTAVISRLAALPVAEAAHATDLDEDVTIDAEGVVEAAQRLADARRILREGVTGETFDAVVLPMASLRRAVVDLTAMLDQPRYQDLEGYRAAVAALDADLRTLEQLVRRVVVRSRAVQLDEFASYAAAEGSEALFAVARVGLRKFIELKVDIAYAQMGVGPSRRER